MENVNTNTLNNENSNVTEASTGMSSVLGITIEGEKTKRDECFSSYEEDASINFVGPDSNNVGKIAIFLMRKDVFGRVLSPEDGEVDRFIYVCDILAEDEDSFIAGDSKRKIGSYLMKYPELYSFFRIVETEKEAETITFLIENYAWNLFEKLSFEWPFDVDMLDNLADSIEECYYDESISVKEQELVIEKLKQTKFKRFREQIA